MAHGKAWMALTKRCWPTCERCYRAAKTARTEQKRRRYHGVLDVRISAEGSRRRINELRDKYGYTFLEISEMTGITNIHVGRIARGQTSSIYKSKAKAILAAYETAIRGRKPTHLSTTTMVPASMTRAALRALAAQGYTRRMVYEMSGIYIDTISRVMQDPKPGRPDVVRLATEQRAIAAARSVGSSYGGSADALGKAKARGWLPTIYVDGLV